MKRVITTEPLMGESGRIYPAGTVCHIESMYRDIADLRTVIEDETIPDVAPTQYEDDK